MTTKVIHHRYDDSVTTVTDTSGEAFLRNGWSQVTRLSLVEHGDQTDIEVVNSRGTVTNGLIMVKTEDLLEAMARFILAKTNMEGSVARLFEISEMVGQPGTNLMDIDEQRVDIWEEIATTLINLAGDVGGEI